MDRVTFTDYNETHIVTFWITGIGIVTFYTTGIGIDSWNVTLEHFSLRWTHYYCYLYNALSAPQKRCTVVGKDTFCILFCAFAEKSVRHTNKIGFSLKPGGNHKSSKFVNMTWTQSYLYNKKFYQRHRKNLQNYRPVGKIIQNKGRICKIIQNKIRVNY